MMQLIGVFDWRKAQCKGKIQPFNALSMIINTFENTMLSGFNSCLSQTWPRGNNRKE